MQDPTAAADTIGHRFAEGIAPGRLLRRAHGVESFLASAGDGRSLVVRMVASAAMSVDRARWLELQVATLAELALPGVAGPVRLHHTLHSIYLVRPFIEGATLAERLASGPMPAAEAMAVARGLLATLQLLHARGLVHGNIKPSNVVLPQGQPRRPVLLDIGLARHTFLTGQFEEVTTADVLYLSPEQSGQLERGVDARTDLFAVGLVLYQALAGHPPLMDSDVPEILRRRLTTGPAPLAGRVGAVPPALDRVVARLLRVAPRDRYQTARGAEADLAALAGAIEAGRPDEEIVVGAQDLRSQVTEPAFTGRRDELAALEQLLAGAAAGHGGLALVEGTSGSGKTWLLEALARRATEKGSWVLRGHARTQVPPRPLETLSQVAGAIATGVATGRARHQRLKRAVGSLSAAISAWLPPLGPVLGEGPAAPAAPADAVDPHAEERGLGALSLVIDSLGCERETCLLLLDDVQWIDSLTLRVLERWQGEASRDRVHVLVVLALRSEEVAKDHPLRSLPALARVRLGRFSDAEIHEQLASMAGRLPEAAVGLVREHAGGNPFLASAMLQGLVESGALRAGAGGWELAQPAAADLQVSSLMADTLATRLARLPASERQLLEAGAVLGRRFSPALACALAGVETDRWLSTLHALRGRLVWLNGSGTTCTFLHDRIRERIRAGLPEHQLSSLHQRAAALLVEQPDASAFDLAYHLEAAGNLARALPYALRAAERSLVHQDMEVAERYFRIAARALDDAGERAERGLRYRVARGLGNVLLVRSDYQECAAWLDQAAALADDDRDRADVAERQTQLALKRGDLPAATRHGERALRLVGRHVPRNTLFCLLVVLWEVLVQVLHTQLPELLVDRRPFEGADDEMFAIRVYNSLNGPYFFARSGLWVLWAHLRALNLSERYPPSTARGREYGVHGSACSGFPRLFERAIRYTRAGARMCAEHGDMWGQAHALQFLALTQCATGRYREAVSTGHTSARLFERAGDIWEAQGASNSAALALYRMGQLKPALDESIALYQRGRQVDPAHGVAFAVNVWVRASEGHLPADILARELERREGHIQTSSLVAQAEAIRLLAHDRPAEAETLLDTWLQRMRRERAFFHESNISMVVYLLVAQRQLAEKVPPENPRARRQVLARAAKTSRRALRAARRFRNNLPLALREAARVAAMAGRDHRARRLADRSVRAADNLGAAFERELSREVRGRLGVALGWPDAADELASARARLEALRAPLGTEASAPVTVSLLDRFGALLEAGHRIARSLAQTDVFESLRAGALALLGAQRVSILEHAGPDGRPPDVVYGDAGAVSPLMVREALASRTPVRRPTPAAPLTGDPTLVRAAVRSALCAPILVRGKVFAMLYATHGEVEGAFGDQAREIVEFLTTLAGAALENAEGFRAVEAFSHELEQHVAQRTEDLARVNGELDRSIQRLERTQEQLVHAGRMAAVGTLVAGLSHELNNPLSVIVGNVENLSRLLPSDDSQIPPGAAGGRTTGQARREAGDRDAELLAHAAHRPRGDRRGRADPPAGRAGRARGPQPRGRTSR